MKEFKNIIIKGKYEKPILTDIFYLHTSEKKPAIIYAHGFNGFKDWGNFDLIAKQFASASFVFIKFNFSHNGTSPQHPQEFVDLEAYANNNYTKEIDDLGTVLDWTISDQEHAAQIDADKIYFLGHSLGGGIAILKAFEDSHVKALATWASVTECQTPWGNWPSEKIKQWIETGRQYITNSRTKQELPINYQLFEDYQFNKERLNIEQAVKNIAIPFLICHGTQDTSVPVEKAYLLHGWNESSELFLVESDHVFGRKHPWTEAALPEAMQIVVDKTISFFKKCS